MIVHRVVSTALIVIATVAVSGCSAAMIARVDATAIDAKAELVFGEGTSRREIEAKLGAPDASRVLPDGSRVDRHTYMVRNPEWRKLKWQAAGYTVMTVGFWEAAGVPLAAWEIYRHRHQATFRYDGDGVVIGHAAPPAYGMADDAVGPLAFGDIRAACRAEHPDDPHGLRDGAAPPGPAYGACVVWRMAIWGVD